MKRFLTMLLALVMLAGAVPTVLAAEAPEGYYGSKLQDPAAIAFYQVLETMDFKSGESVPVEAAAVTELAEAYAGGSVELLRSFGAAVDSFRYDHTEFFYVDWDMLSVKVGRQNGQYVVSVGTGRTDSYLLDKNADIEGQTAEFNAALEAMALDVQAKAGADASVKDIAKAANDAVCDKVTYDFCDDADGNATEESKYIRTAYGALVNGRAVCEGYSRLYKALLNKLGVTCELVSGYYLDGERFEPHMWTYVLDEEGDWYAVDVTMNDGHRLLGSDATRYEKYFWQTEELFAIDHIEDGKVSSAEYEMPYPELHKFWATPTSSGKFESGYEAYNGSSGFWFSYDGKSAAQLAEEDGLYMAFRTATTNVGVMEWSPWQSAAEMERIYAGGVVSDNGKTYFLMPNTSMVILETGIFDIPDDSGSGYAKRYSDEAEKNHLIEKMDVENPAHNEEYIAPAYVARTEPAELFQRRQNITETQHIVLEYTMPLRELEGGLEITWDVSSYNNRDLSLEAVQKNAKLENVEFDGDRTISFDFTPSRAYNHNMIFYNFTVHNMVNVLPDGRDGVELMEFSIMYEYKDSIACCKIYNDGRLYVNSYAQPSIAMNGDLSMTGWTYEDENGETRKVSESQRSQLAMVVTQPQNSEELAKAAMNKAGADAAIAAKSTTYEIDLNICGKILQIPNGSYMRVNLGIPDEFADMVGNEDISFKLYHFKRNADGTLDYDNPEEIQCVMTPYGIIAEVNSFSPYVLVAVDNSKLPEEKRDTSKSVALVCSGHGGKVESASLVGTVDEGQTVTYTLTPDDGYEVEFVTLNGVSVPVTDNTVTLAYEELQSSNTLEVGYVAASVREAEENEGIENVNPTVSYTVTFNTNGGSEISDKYVESGTPVAKPENPTREGYTFVGWFTDSALTEHYDFSASVTSDITLYAKWTEVLPNTFTVTFNTEDGYEVDTQTVEEGKCAVKPADPTKEGYTFEGWYTDSEWTNAYDFESPVTASITLYAKWTEVVPETFTVTFDTNGGTEVEAETVIDGHTATEPETPTKEGYTFEGWYADAELTETYDFATPVTASITLYAKWTKDAPDTPVVPDTPVTPSKPTAPTAPAVWKNPFTDVAEGDWYYSAVEFAVENGLFRGISEDSFAPNGTMTRAMLATVLHRLAKEPEADAKALFSDVADGQYYTEAISWAAEKNIVSGYGDGLFGPEDFVTREQLAVMLWRYAGCPAGSGDLEVFTDSSRISPWAADALSWAVEQKLIGGIGDGLLAPEGNATRAETAAILMRYSETVK